MSKITVTTIAGQTSGGDANTVKIESGDDLVVNTDTLFVDASADKVGINQASPTYQLSVLGATQSTVEIESASTTGESRLYFTDPDSTGTGEVGYYHNGDTMRFATGGVERMRLSSDGLHIGGTGSANALDDYEEGTWTPTYDTGFPSGSPEEVVQGAKYVKVGRLVHCILRLQARNDGTSMQLGGLPFVPNCDGGFGTVGHDSHTTRKERIFSGSSWIAWIYSGTSGSLGNHYFTITYTTDS